MRKRAKVLFFDDNRGRGLLKILETGERINVSYKNIQMEGFKVLFEGQIVEVEEKDGEYLVYTEIEDGDQI